MSGESSKAVVPERWRDKHATAWHPEQKQLIEELGAAENKNAGYYRMLYDDLGCRESCMGWVNERAENAESELTVAREQISAAKAEHGKTLLLAQKAIDRVTTLEAQIQTLEKELRQYRARTYPMQCGLCELQIESADDCEWHGLGNCVDICDSCDGNGFIDKTACKFASQHHLGPCPHCGANTIHPKERWNDVTLSTAERMEALARQQQTQLAAHESTIADLREAMQKIKQLLLTRPMIGYVADKAHGGMRHWSACEEAIKLTDAALALPDPIPQSQWISVKDRLPEPCEMHSFLVWIPNNSKIGGYRELAAYGEWICEIEDLDESDPRFVRDNDDGNCKGFGWNREEDTHGGPYDYIILDLNDKVTHWQPLPAAPSPQSQPEGAE